MSYTLRGRIESRFAAALGPVLVACLLAGSLHEWWPVQLAALMLGVGLTLDSLAYDRLLDYQPGWLAVPLGLLELGLVMGLARSLSIDAPLSGALAFYAAAWLIAQILGHAGFPLLRLSYAEDGGALGLAGPAAALLALGALGSSGGVYWAKLPPTVRLSEGIHDGPLVITRRETLVGERGAVVRGGIVIRSSGVTVRDVAVLGGENGIEVDGDIDGIRNVVLDGVTIVGAHLDGIHVRRAQVVIRDCVVDSAAGWTQGIDVSFAADMGMSMIEDCTISGGREGILVDSALVTVRNNRVTATSLRGISMTEMSMGMIDENNVAGGLGIGIFCGDQSECMIESNRVSGTRPDRSSGDASRMGYGIESHFGATAELSGNELVGNARREGAFSEARIVHR
jgi:hypothetical protein